MGQLHRRFSNEQVRVLLQTYCYGKIKRSDLQEMLSIIEGTEVLQSYRGQPPHPI